MILDYTCRNCGVSHEFEVTFAEPGRVDGPPHLCYPPAPREVNGPEKCDKCGEKLDEDSVYELACDKAQERNIR